MTTRLLKIFAALVAVLSFVAINAPAASASEPEREQIHAAESPDGDMENVAVDGPDTVDPEFLLAALEELESSEAQRVEVEIDGHAFHQYVVAEGSLT